MGKLPSDIFYFIADKLVLSIILTICKVRLCEVMCGYFCKGMHKLLTLIYFALSYILCGRFLQLLFFVVILNCRFCLLNK